jgi:hypothetical protein
VNQLTTRGRHTVVTRRCHLNSNSIFAGATENPPIENPKIENPKIENPMSMSTAHNPIEVASSDQGTLKPSSRLWGYCKAIIFAISAVVAMGGWLYLLAQGLWAATSWLFF